MKSALSLALIACLVASALPATAQEQAEGPVPFDTRGPATPATAGPLGRATMREAARLAASQRAQPADSGWSRVRELASGTEVTVTVKGSQPGKRYVVLANESGLTSLNLTAVGLQFPAARVLLDMASHHPENLLAAHTGRTVEQDNVRVGPDGVFMAGRKVADLGQVVETIARIDVEIRTVRTRGSVSGAAIGTGAGLLLGSVTFLAIGFNHCLTVNGGCHGAWGPLSGLALVGFPVAGGLWGYHHGHTTVIEEVIYRAP